MGRDELAVWVRNEAKKRGWSFVELARQANTNVGSVYAVVEKQRDVGFRFCAKIADAFTVPRERVLRAAGLLPPVIAVSEDDRMKQEVDEYWIYLSSEDRKLVTELARLLYERWAQRPVEEEAAQG